MLAKALTQEIAHPGTLPVKAGKRLTVSGFAPKDSNVSAMHIFNSKSYIRGRRQAEADGGAMGVDHQVTGLAIVQNLRQAGSHGHGTVKLSIESSGANSEPMLY